VPSDTGDSVCVPALSFAGFEVRLSSLFRSMIFERCRSGMDMFPPSIRPAVVN